MPSDADADAGISPEPETTSQHPETQESNGEGNEGQAVATTGEEPKGEPSFGGLSPREAGLRSAQRRREQARATEREAVEQSSGKTIIVRTPVEVGHIIARLAVDAKKGNTQAARELREWMRQYPADDETDISALDTRTRQQVLARVLAEIAADEGALPAGPEA